MGKLKDSFVEDLHSRCLELSHKLSAAPSDPSALLRLVVSVSLAARRMEERAELLRNLLQLEAEESRDCVTEEKP